MSRIVLSRYKVTLLMVKYLPLIMFLIMWIHVILLLLGINSPIAITVAGSAILPSIFILCISTSLKFCYLHKSLTVYSLVVDLCINFENYIGFGILLFPMRFLCFISGLILFFILIFNFKRYNCNCINTRELINYLYK